MVLIFFFTTLFLLRTAYVFRFRFDSDEAQHLHVVWGWANGLVQYRDVFDNHMPLFHLACVPIYWTIGMRPDILIWMRLAMLPIYIATLGCVYRIGTEIFSRRVGLWAALMAGVCPFFFLTSVEFRTDDLWTCLWVLAFALLVAGQLNLKRSFVVGMVLGFALGVSMKTPLMLIALGGALISALVLGRTHGFDARRIFACALAGVGGLLLVPTALAAGFAAAGMWKPFFYGTVQHNLVAGGSPWKQRLPFYVVGLFLSGWIARMIFQAASSPQTGARRVVVFLSATLYLLTFSCFWLTTHRQNYLPFYPLAAIFIAAAGCSLFHRLARRLSGFGWHPYVPAFSLAALAAAQMAAVEWQHPLQHDDTRQQTELLTEVLRLTDPTDFVIDQKGETVFRKRSYYYVLETMTHERMVKGIIPDDIPEAIVRTRTCVTTIYDDRFPQRTRRFLRDNFLRVGELRVAGAFLTPASPEANGVGFEIKIPARYCIVSNTGKVSGLLDGTPYEGSRFLERGHHEFRPQAASDRLAVLWAQANERGFSPFHYGHSANEL